MTLPSVRYFLLCEQIGYDPAEPHRVSIHGLVSTIRARGRFPIQHPELWIYLQLADCRGSGFVQIRIVEADSERVIFETKQHGLHFGNDPLQTYGVQFCLQEITFPEAGLYNLELWYNESLLDQRPLFVS